VTKVLSSIKLITKSGTRARFLVGGEVPFVVAIKAVKDLPALSPPALQVERIRYNNGNYPDGSERWES